MIIHIYAKVSIDNIKGFNEIVGLKVENWVV